jgi:hypothetical protein
LDQRDAKRSAEAHERESRSTNEQVDDAEEIRRIRAMPKEIGVLLIVAGVGGLLLPGPVGTPFLVLGAVMLWPRAFGRVETFVEQRFPRLHHQSVRQIRRFLDDMNRRYPISKA